MSRATAADAKKLITIKLYECIPEELDSRAASKAEQSDFFEEELRINALERNASEVSLPTSPGLINNVGMKVVVKVVDQHEIHKGILSSRKLRSEHCYILDGGHRSDVFIWNGNESLPGQKREALLCVV